MPLEKMVMPSISETIDGKPYAIMPLTMTGLSRLQKILDRVPYPRDMKAVLDGIEGMKADGTITEAEAKAARNEAIAERMAWPAEIIFDPRARSAIIYDPVARAELIAVALEPAVGADEARAISDAIGPAQLMRIYVAAMKIDDDPEPNSESHQGPKGSDTTAA